MGKSLLYCAALLMLLTACGDMPVVQPKPYAVTTHVPAEVLQCPEVPAVPGLEARQDAAAEFVATLHQTAVTCRANLYTVAGILKDDTRAR